jgi:hypothetical protein
MPSVMVQVLAFTMSMERQAFEPTGLVPRSIIRTFDRFRQQLLPETKAAAVQEFRISRYQVLVSVKSLASLVFIPILVNALAKTFVLNPATEYLWNSQQNEIFLNSYQEDRALREMEDFSEKVYFESLLSEESAAILAADWRENNAPQASQASQRLTNLTGLTEAEAHSPERFEERAHSQARVAQRFAVPSNGSEGRALQGNATRPTGGRAMESQFQDKAMELALLYNKESMLAITNVLGDFVTFVTIASLFVWMRPQIVILKSFLTESIYSLSDTTKSFLLILVTDLLVGFHSPRGWEIGIEMLLRHFGLPENQDFIFLFVAAFPVFLDTIFKYWIFRYLNKISPSTVATYHNMIE